MRTTARLTAALLASCVVAQVNNAAPADVAGAAMQGEEKTDFSSIGRLLQGKLIVGGTMFYLLADVKSVDQSEGSLTLHADAYSFEVRAVSIMHCDYEGPHIELSTWKQGLSAPVALKRAGNRFALGAAVFDSATPAFPTYTSTELRRAIAAHMSEGELASEEEAAPCAPFLGQHTLTIRRGAEVIQEVVFMHAGGC